MKLETFKKLHGFFIEDLQIDQTDKIERKITEKDIDNFAKLTGDNNPVHTNLDFAKKTIFKQKVAHGFLSASLISTLIATKLPGPGSIYLSQNLKFLAPVFIDDLVRVKVTVKEIDHEKKKVKLQTECFKNEKKIISGEAIVLVNSKKDFKNNESF
ncbi:MAG: (R)-hydratase [Rickettsiales bacterium]|jgi:3-hydroxybutyryl-CoA dehydratase|nr:(R)-hydratase [Rickettsiales bacterium]RPG15655.1 MAG: MaoC family dehydratase [Pelagibacteraceae bacterium TMED195]|tara:strand:+ start:1485 stop:1952 length:468 start_codon:yes stop_codon:yes gene_type:complete